MQRPVQVEKGVALRARMELERLRAEKEQREQKAKAKAAADADARGRSPSSPVCDDSQKLDGDDGEGRGYEPDGYGRDDPYRRQEDVEKELAAQQASPAALSPATAAQLGERSGSGSGWGLAGAHPPKARPTPKAVLGRGQEEAVEAGTGARVIQKRQVPPAVVVKVVPQERGSSRQPDTPKQPDDTSAAKPGEAHGKTRGEPSQLLAAGRSGHGAPPASRITGAVLGSQATTGEKGRAEASSSTTQWLTLRRDGGDAGDQTHGVCQRAGKEHQAVAPSAWGQPATATATAHGPHGVHSGSNGPVPFDPSRGGKTHDRAADGPAAGELPLRSPRVRSGEAVHQVQRQDTLHSGHAGDPRPGDMGGKPWPAQESSPGQRPPIGAGGSFVQPPQPTPSQFDKDSGRSFSSLFVAPGQHERGGVHCSASGASAGGVFPEEQSRDEELRRNWPEAGRGPPAREQKQIFDHKTGKMRDVEVTWMTWVT